MTPTAKVKHRFANDPFLPSHHEDVVSTPIGIGARIAPRPLHHPGMRVRTWRFEVKKVPTESLLGKL